MADTYEQNLGQKSSLTTSDYIRVVGSDNVSYKQRMKSVADAIRTIVSTQDLNTATKNGEIYQFGASAENHPADMYYGYVFAMSQDSDGTNCHQLAVDRGGSSRGIVYTRSRANSTWSDWIKMPTRSEIDAIKSVKTVSFESSAATKEKFLNWLNSNEFAEESGLWEIRSSNGFMIATAVVAIVNRSYGKVEVVSYYNMNGSYKLNNGTWT